jgi:hypothetical protein
MTRLVISLILGSPILAKVHFGFEERIAANQPPRGRPAKSDQGDEQNKSIDLVRSAYIKLTMSNRPSRGLVQCRPLPALAAALSSGG